MPKYHFICRACGVALLRIVPRDRLNDLEQTCRTAGCPGPLVRTPRPPTVNVVEILDNGHMTKALERPADAERLYRERAKAKPED